MNNSRFVSNRASSYRLTKNNMSNNVSWLVFFTAPCTIVQGTVLLSHVVCPSVRLSVTLVDQDDIRWKSLKLIAGTISTTTSLFVAKTPFTYSEGNMGKFGGD